MKQLAIGPITVISTRSMQTNVSGTIDIHSFILIDETFLEASELYMGTMNDSVSIWTRSIEDSILYLFSLTNQIQMVVVTTIERIKPVSNSTSNGFMCRYFDDILVVLMKKLVFL